VELLPSLAGTESVGTVGTLTAQVADALFQLLRSGACHVGDRLPNEQALGARLGVGRSTVREAVRRLLALGLLEIRRGRGTYVRSLDPRLLLDPRDFRDALNRSMTLELLEVRYLVEPGAAALAAIRATPNDVARLARDVERLEHAVAAGYRPAEDLGFHLDVVRATHNAALSKVSYAIISFYTHDDALPTGRDVREHRAIFEAIRDHESARARACMEQHLQAEEAHQRKRHSR
jgi:GntR family transcriptional repressor for pyruvate dehydrogenase complex